MGRKLDEGCKLDFVAPLSSDESFFAQIKQSEIDDNINKWDNTLVGYVLGEKPYFFHLKACVMRLWKPTCPLDILTREMDIFSSDLDQGKSASGSFKRVLGSLMVD